MGVLPFILLRCRYFAPTLCVFSVCIVCGVCHCGDSVDDDLVCGCMGGLVYMYSQCTPLKPDTIDHGTYLSEGDKRKGGREEIDVGRGERRRGKVTVPCTQLCTMCMCMW